ncbi:MAG TPA: AraC family transcriptional regulator, partial [Polyangiaceae bacterium]|nr:AraC family transcriptional regulator [Polyangiaceae bacterium]
RTRSDRARPLTADLSLSPALPELLSPVANWQALLSLVVANAFDELKLSVALWMKGDWWYPIAANPARTVMDFEYSYGVGERRWTYNRRCFELVKQRRRTVHGQHAGFHDLYVPVLAGREVRGIFVAGSFALERPTSSDVLRRWRDITGNQGRVTDPVFSQYLSTTLDTLTLEGELFPAFQRLMTCFAGLVAGNGDANALAAEAHGLRQKLINARFDERMRQTAHGFVDDQTAPTFATYSHGDFGAIGLEQIPDHVVAGLLLGRPNQSDPVDEVIRSDAFQRAAVVLARDLGNIACGRISEHGVFFLVNRRGPALRTKAKLMDIATELAKLARKFDFSLHTGIVQGTEASPLPTRYRSAVQAAERALSQGRGVAFGEERVEQSAERLRELRRELAQSVEDRPNLLSPRFSRYIDAALTHSGYRLESTHRELATGLERLTEPLLANGALDKKSFNELHASLERNSEKARTVTELVALYRSLVTDIEASLKNAKAASQDRGVRRATTFIRAHLGEPLTQAQVAHVAGFAPDYFSRLFRREQGVTFAHYVLELRVERAREMLLRTMLPVEEVQKLCGFRTRTYFHRVFKTATKRTPAEFRQLYRAEHAASM